MELALWADRENVVLTVTNTGPGIPPEIIDRVFDRFFRGDPSHNKEIDGCGLGLSIARRIVETHSGDIRIESEVGKQTAVAVRFPAQRATSGSIAPSPITPAEEPVLSS